MPGAPCAEVTDRERVPTRWVWWTNSAALGIAAIALVSLFAAVGVDELGRLIRSAGWAIAIVVALEGVAFMLRARATHILLRPSQRMVRYPRVVAVQAAASTVQDLTPTGALGDVVKATLLLARVPATEVISAIVAYDILTVYVSAAVVTAGVVASASLGLVPPPLDQALWATAVGLLVLVLAASWLIRRGLLTSLVGPLLRGRLAERLALFDQRIRELQARGREPREAFVCLLAARAVAWLELYVLLRAVGLDPGAGTFVALVLGQMPVARLASILPLGAGISDLGNAGLFALLGMPPHLGIAVAMLVRARQIVVGALTLVVMVWLLAADRITLVRTRARLRRRQPGPGHAAVREA